MSTPRQRPCYKQNVLVPRVERALGSSLRGVKCYIVDSSGMAGVMKRAGWRGSDARGVVGFQLDDDVYVLDGAAWTTLHELVHRAGVNADRMNRYVAEGLTEAIAAELASTPDEYRPTYPTETRWVRETLLPKLGMGAVELGRLLARSRDPARTLADLLVSRDANLDRNKLARDLATQRPDQPSLNRWTMVTRAPAPVTPSSEGEGLGGVLLVSGMALLLPALVDRIARWRTTP